MTIKQGHFIRVLTVLFIFGCCVLSFGEDPEGEPRRISEERHGIQESSFPLIHANDTAEIRFGTEVLKDQIDVKWAYTSGARIGTVCLFLACEIFDFIQPGPRVFDNTFYSLLGGMTSLLTLVPVLRGFKESVLGNVRFTSFDRSSLWGNAAVRDRPLIFFRGEVQFNSEERRALSDIARGHEMELKHSHQGLTSIKPTAVFFMERDGVVVPEDTLVLAGNLSGDDKIYVPLKDVKSRSTCARIFEHAKQLVKTSIRRPLW